MSFEQTRLLNSTAREVQVLKQRIDAICDLIDMFASRKPGRPTLVEVAEMERLQAQMRAGVH